MRHRPYPEGIVEKIAAYMDADLPRGDYSLSAACYASVAFPFQRKREMKRLMRMVQRKRPETIMEIGTSNGGGLYHWCQCQPSVKRVIGCELRPIPYKHVFESRFPEMEFLWLEGGSQGKGNIERAKAFGGLDCLFIDGDKLGYEKDFNAYRPLLNPGALVFFHDIQEGQTAKAFRRICERTKFDFVKVLDTSEALDAIQKERQGIPHADAYEGWLRHWRGRSGGFGVLFIPEAK